LSKISSASIGVATYPGKSAGAESLVKNADVAMYQAKEQGCNSYRFQAVTVNQLAGFTDPSHLEGLTSVRPEK
jgi:predicted signal transduction protein with EAL and GGDEF domain